MGKKDIAPGVVVILFGFLGLILAWLEKFAIDNGYVLDEYIQGTLTWPDLAIITIIVSLLCGVVIAAWIS